MLLLFLTNDHCVALKNQIVLLWGDFANLVLDRNTTQNSLQKLHLPSLIIRSSLDPFKKVLPH